MSLNRDWFQQLRSTFVPQPLWDAMVVAGGYAASPTQAGDIDIWVLSDRGEPLLSAESQMQQNATRIMSFIGKKAIRGEVPAPEWNPAEYDNTQARLVVTLPRAYEGKNVQLLVTPAESAQELVDWFDITSHAVAKQLAIGHESMVLTFGKGWNGIQRQPRVTRWDTPEDTLARLHKVTQRYGTVPHPADVERLVQAIRDKEAARGDFESVLGIAHVVGGCTECAA